MGNSFVNANEKLFELQRNSNGKWQWVCCTCSDTPNSCSVKKNTQWYHDLIPIKQINVQGQRGILTLFPQDENNKQDLYRVVLLITKINTHEDLGEVQPIITPEKALTEIAAAIARPNTGGNQYSDYEKQLIRRWALEKHNVNNIDFNSARFYSNAGARRNSPVYIESEYVGMSEWRLPPYHV